MSSSVNGRAADAAERLTSLSAVQPVFRRRDLLALGIDDVLQSAMFRRNLLIRLRHGVYAPSEVLAGASARDRHRIDVAAAAAAAEEPTWAVGLSAALVHGLPLPFAVPDVVSLVRQAGQDQRALRRPSRHSLHVPATSVTTCAFDPTDTMTVDGVPVVTPDVAAVTAAVALTARWQVGLFDSAMWSRRTSQERLAHLVDRWRHLGHREQLLDSVSRARPGAQTILETISRLALMEQGLPEPQLQVPFHDGAGLIGYVDMWWPELRVIGEADGAVKYGSGDDVFREKVREDRLRALGPMVVRWTWAEIRTSPDQVARRIRGAARRAA